MAEVIDPTVQAQPVSAYPSAVVDAAQIKDSTNSALQTRDVNGLIGNAQKMGIDTPEGSATLATAKDIQERANQFKTYTAPIEQAKTDSERNIAAANALRNVSKEPLYGQALIAFIMGQKEAAFQLATGGRIKTTTEYAKDNGSIIQVATNELGQPQSYFDVQQNRLLTPQEYSARGGSVTDIDRTMAMKTAEQNRSKYSEAFSNEKISNNKLYQAYTGINDTVTKIEQLVGNIKSDLPADVYANWVGNLTTAQSQGSVKSDSSTYVNQIQNNAAQGKGQTIDQGLAAKLGIPEKYIGKVFSIEGNQLVSRTDNFRKSIDSLKSQTDSGSLSAETSKNTTSNLESLLTSEKFKAAIAGKPKEEQSRIIRQMKAGLTLSNEVGSEITRTVDQYGKPAFISLPTAAAFSDPQSQLMIQLAQHRQNYDAIRAYKSHFDENAKYYDQTKTLPTPGDIGSAFVDKPIYKEIRNKWSNDIQRIVDTDYTSRVARQAQPAAPAAAGPVAPPKPKAKPSLADLKKQAGG